MGRDKKNKKNHKDIEINQEQLTENPVNAEETDKLDVEQVDDEKEDLTMKSEKSEKLETDEKSEKTDSDINSEKSYSDDKSKEADSDIRTTESDSNEKLERSDLDEKSEKTNSDKKSETTDSDINSMESDESNTDKKTAEPSKETEKEEDKKGDKNEFYEKEPFIDPSIYAHRRKKRVHKTVAISIAAFVLIVYFSGVLFHMNRFGTMISINGMDVSGKSAAQVEKLLLDASSSYELSVKFKDEVYTIALGDADSKVELTEDVKSVIKKRTSFLWFIDAFKAYDYNIPYTVLCDRAKLAAYMQDCESMDVSHMEDPVDAKVIMEDGEVIVLPDETGTKLDVEKVYDKILYAMKSYEQELDVEEAGCYVEAHITTESDSILRAKEEAEDFLSIEACFDFGDYTYQIPKEELTKMAYVSKDGSVQISRNNVAAYAQKLSDRFSTSYTDRKFKTHDGKKILVYGGYFGWILDPETESSELYDLLCQKKSFTKEPACEKRGYTMCEENDIGYTYVEVDLSNQHVYFYKNGRLKWDTDCVSGQTPGHRTPGGLYGITYKKMYATLIGEDYETPVTYWMPFNGGIGLHDANWRGHFGEDIYTYNGSHGCVNLPVDKAAELFDYVEEGMPVICYWREDVQEVKD